MRASNVLGILIAAALVVSAVYVFMSSPGAAEIVEMTLGSMEDVKSYRFSLDGEMTMKINESEMTTLMSASGAVDYVNRSLFMNSNYSMIAGEEIMVMEMDIYLLNDTMYLRMSSPETGEQWLKMRLPEELASQSWSSRDQMEQQKMLLNSSEVRRLQDEKIDGIDCYVIEVIPDAQKLLEILNSQNSFGELSSAEWSMIEATLNNTEMKVVEWIDKEMKLPVKSEVHLNMVLSPKSFELAAPEIGNSTMSMQMKMTMKFYDYNEKFEIELPEEAVNAVEVPS